MTTDPPEGMEWLKRKPDTFEYHLAHPEVDIGTYMRGKRLEHGKNVLSYRRIYLDTNHWIHLRDTLLGRPANQLHKQIYDLLRGLKESQNVLCPISYPVFTELMRQIDPATRKATAQVIDMFADGCCTQPPHEILKREVLHFVRRGLSKSEKLYPVSQMVWTKVSFILGDLYASSRSFSPETNLAMQKAMDDLLWSVTLEEMISMLPIHSPVSGENLDTFADHLTQGARDHEHEFTNFDEVFLHELAGGLDGHQEMLGELMAHLCHKRGFRGDVPGDQAKESGRHLASLIRCAFEQKKLSTEMPSVHIPAGLHAALRNDRKRKYRPGDFADFVHATVALPYYDMFFTENSLKHLLCTKPLEFDKAYGTLILSSDDEIVDALSGMTGREDHSGATDRG